MVTIISIVVALLVIGLWMYFIYKFRESNDVERVPLSHEISKKLEIGWTLFAVVIIIVLMIVSYPVLFQLDDNENITGLYCKIPEDALVEGTQGFSWIFYKGGNWDGENYIGGNISSEKVDGCSVVDLNVNHAYPFIFNSSGRLIHSTFMILR